MAKKKGKADAKRRPGKYSSGERDPKKKEEKFEFSFRNKKFRAALPFIVAALVYWWIWIVPTGEKVKDPWYAAVHLVDSARKTNNPKLKTELLNKGGNELKRLVAEHPYHARIHFFLGYYYFAKKNWDSALVKLKKAAKMDSGATINPVWHQANELIVKAAVNKSLALRNQNKPQEALNVLLNASKYGQNNPVLNKFIGDAYFRKGEYDLALKYFLHSYKFNQKDADLCNMIGVLYKYRNDLNRAASFFKTALRLNTNHKAAKQNLSSLKNQIN